MKISFIDFLIEEELKKKSESNIKHFFDMDDTLFHHDLSNANFRVHVNDENGNRVSSMTDAEYNAADPKELAKKKLSFSDYRKSDLFTKTARPVRKIIAKMKAIKKNNPNVEILTARSDLDNQEKFANHMNKYGIDINKDFHVRRAGNIKAKTDKAKAQIVSDHITQHGLNKVHLYDDNPKNLDTFLKLKSQHPEVELHAHHVQHDPISGNTQINTQSYIPKKKETDDKL